MFLGLRGARHATGFEWDGLAEAQPLGVAHVLLHQAERRPRPGGDGAGPVHGRLVQLVIRDGSCCAYDLSPLVYLQAGQPYYFDAVMQEGVGEDYLEVTWKPPGSTGFSAIPSSNLAYIYGLAPSTPPASSTLNVPPCG